MKKILFNTYIVYIIHIVYSTSVPKVDTTKSENHISEQDPNILNLMVSHYDCAKQNNLRQFSLLNVETCKQAPSDIQHTKTQAKVYVRAKAKRIIAFKCGTYIKTGKVWCSQTFSSSRRYDLLQWEQNTIELPKILDPIECKNMIRYLNATDSKDLNNYNNSDREHLITRKSWKLRITNAETTYVIKTIK